MEIMETEVMTVAAIKGVATGATAIEAMGTGATEIGASATGAMVASGAMAAIVAIRTGATAVVIVATVATEATVVTEVMGSVRTMEGEEQEDAAPATIDLVMAMRTGDPEELIVVTTVASDAMSLVTGRGTALTDPRTPNQTVATSAEKPATGRRIAICASSASDLDTIHFSVRRSVVLQANPMDDTVPVGMRRLGHSATRLQVV